MKLNLEIFPLPLLRKCCETIMQCIDVDLIISNILPDSGVVLKVKRGNYFREFSFGKAESLSFRKELYLPEVLSEEEAEFVFEYGPERVIKKVMFRPVRKWTIYLVLHSHTDLGFTAPVSDVAKIHNDNTGLAALYCKETEHWPEGSRFKWTCEVSWQVQNYLMNSHPAKIREFIEQVRKRNIEIAGMYSGELTELLGHEQAARTFYYAARLRREYGISINTAMLCDVPGCTKGFVQIMAKSGIKNFILADNNFIAPFLKRTDLPRPFYWCGDDDTKVLSWYTDHPFYAYWEGANYGLADSYSETRKKLPYKLAQLEHSGYTYNMFQLQYAFDNIRIEFRPAAIVKEWNETWEYPKIRLSTAGEFLDKMREDHGSDIPERKGDWTCWWDGIVNGFPHETAQSRYLHNKIPAVETISSFLKLSGGRADYSSFELEKLYDDTLAFDEHSGTGLVWEAKSQEIQEKALKEGYGFIHNSFVKTAELDTKATSGLSKLITVNGESVIVFNTYSRKQDLPVSVRCNKEDSVIYLRDKHPGNEITGIVKDNTLSFTAPGVPAMGYKVFEISHSSQEVSQFNENEKVFINAEESVLENEYWKITVCNRDGCIKSIFNKETGKEITTGEFNIPLVYETKPVVKIEMGKYIPEIYNGDEVPGEIVPFHESLKTTVQVVKDETGVKSFIISHFFGENKWYEQKIYSDGSALIFTNSVNGRLINDSCFVEQYLGRKGMLYQKYAFNLKNAKLRYEAPCAVLNPADEQFKGSCKDYYAMQGWCQVYDDDLVVNFSSPDTPLTDVGAVALQKYREEFPQNPAELYARLLSLREVSGEIKSPYEKEPGLNFRFAVSVNKPDKYFVEGEDIPSLMPAYTLRDRITNTSSAVFIPGKQEGILSADSCSFFSGLAEGIEILTFKKAEDDDGFILRLREILGRSTACKLKCCIKEIKKACRCLVTEEIIEEISMADNIVPVNFNPFSVETIRLRFNNED